MNLTIHFDSGNRGRRFGFQLPPSGASATWSTSSAAHRPSRW
jgi:hypothetical protein